jgi:hypothetical protein
MGKAPPGFTLAVNQRHIAKGAVQRSVAYLNSILILFIIIIIKHVYFVVQRWECSVNKRG